MIFFETPVINMHSTSLLALRQTRLDSWRAKHLSFLPLINSCPGDGGEEGGRGGGGGVKKGEEEGDGEWLRRGRRRRI